MNDDAISNVFARGMEMRHQRAKMLFERKKFTPLDRAELEAIRARHPEDADVDALLLDIVFLRDWLEQTTDNFHETLDRLNDARRKLAHPG